jgi:hypothetical protein
MRLFSPSGASWVSAIPSYQPWRARGLCVSSGLWAPLRAPLPRRDPFISLPSLESRRRDKSSVREKSSVADPGSLFSLFSSPFLSRPAPSSPLVTSPGPVAASDQGRSDPDHRRLGRIPSQRCPLQIFLLSRPALLSLFSLPLPPPPKATEQSTKPATPRANPALHPIPYRPVL